MKSRTFLSIAAGAAAIAALLFSTSAPSFARPPGPPPGGFHGGPGFYPGIATCPVEWQIVMGTSATNPPAPPR